MFKRVLFSTALLTALTGSAAFAQTGVGVWAVRDLGSTGASRGVRDMDMPSASVIWGVQYDGTQGGGPVQDVFVSTDGGTNWLANSIVTANAGGKDLANVSAIDGNTAYFSAYDPAATGNTGLLIKTADGGNTFTEVALPPVAFLNFVHFFDANTGLVMSDPGIPSTTDFQVLRTTDAGATWTQVSGTALPNAVAGDYGLANQFTAVGDHFWFSTLKGRVYHSPDRGVTWTSSDTGFRDVAPQAALRNITFADAMNGLAVGGATPGTKRTTDGGVTWTDITPTGSFYSNNVTRVPGQLTPTYVGANVATTSAPGIGSSFSTDGGLNWTKLDSGNAQYTDVVFFDATHGWAGGFTGTNGTAGIFAFTGTLTGVAPTASVSVNRGLIDFAATVVGAISTQTFTVTNSGAAPLNITGITATGPFTVTPNVATTVAPGASVTMTVTFAPTTAGAQTGSIVIASNAANTPSFTVTLTGSTPAATVAVSRASIAFAATVVGATTTQTFTVTNSGTAPLNITGITATGPFTVTPNVATTVAPGASVTLTVTFAPTTAGAQTGTVVIASNAANTPSVTVALTGTARAAIATVAVSRISIAFAATAVGSTTTRTFTVTNSGTAPLNITSITATGPFTVTPNAAATVAPGGVVTMTVTFTPTTSGAQTGSVTIASNATNTPSVTVALTGTATPTGLTNDALSAAVQLYPSPVSVGNAALLRLTGALTLTGTPATVTDALGRSVLTLPAPAGATELTVATGTLRAGLYTVQVRTSRGLVARTLVVQ